MKNTVFKGTATAIVTPMKDDLSVDYDALGRLIDFQINSGINAIVAVGTTGESATLEYSEQKDVIRFTVERVAGRVPVIAGAGTNNTLPFHRCCGYLYRTGDSLQCSRPYRLQPFAQNRCKTFGTPQYRGH